MTKPNKTWCFSCASVSIVVTKLQKTYHSAQITLIKFARYKAHFATSVPFTNIQLNWSHKKGAQKHMNHTQVQHLSGAIESVDRSLCNRLGGSVWSHLACIQIGTWTVCYYGNIDAAGLPTLHHPPHHKHKENKYHACARDWKRTSRHALVFVYVLELVHVLRLVPVVQAVDRGPPERRVFPPLSRNTHLLKPPHVKKPRFEQKINHDSNKITMLSIYK